MPFRTVGGVRDGRATPSHTSWAISGRRGRRRRDRRGPSWLAIIRFLWRVGVWGLLSGAVLVTGARFARAGETDGDASWDRDGPGSRRTGDAAPPNGDAGGGDGGGAVGDGGVAVGDGGAAIGDGARIGTTDVDARRAMPPLPPPLPTPLPTPGAMPAPARLDDHVPRAASDQSVITARRVAAGAPREDLTAAASVVIPAESPRARDDLGTLLLEIPGANITRAGGIGSFAAVSLRGANPDEVRVYVDGIPLNQAVGGAVDLSTLPLGDVERVEVYRGSTPMVFGQSALGGVISLSTRTPVGTQAAARLGAGSFRTVSSDLTAGGSLGRIRLYGGLHLLRAQGNFPDAPPAVSGGYQPGTRENTDLTQLDGVLRAIFPVGERRELRAGFIGITRDQGLPAQNIFRSEARAATTRHLAHLDYHSRGDLGPSSRLRLALFASTTRDEFIDRARQIVGVPTATRDRTRSIGTIVTGEKALASWTRVTTMLEGRAEDYLPGNQLEPAVTMGYPARRTVATGGLEVDLHSARLDLHLIPSVRLEASRDLRTGRDAQFGALLPTSDPIDRWLPVYRLGILRPIGAGLSARANLGRYARIPSFVELYGYNRGLIGSPELRPETGINADLGLALSRGDAGHRLSASVTAFGAEVDDLIAWQTYSGRTRAQNISRARIWGLETELRLRARRLALTTQTTFLDARDRGEIAARYDRQLEHHPRYRGYARVEWRQPVVRPLFGEIALSSYIDVDGTAGNFRTTGPYSELPPRLLLGAGLALEHARSGLRVVASALNLSDRRVEDFASYPLPGRSFYLTLGWSRVSPPSSP